MKRPLIASAAALMTMPLVGCDRQTADAPPSIQYGDSLCDQCNMIISDGRWATATVIESSRGPQPRVFDDFNCQVNYEVGHPDITVVARWSHNHATREWIRTEEARFLMSPDLRSPMGSNVAAFTSVDEAEALMSESNGDVVSFDVAWKHLGGNDASQDALKEIPNGP